MVEKNSFGISKASYGELLQGRLKSGSDFLISLPCDLTSVCFLRATLSSSSTVYVDCNKSKTRALLEFLLTELGLKHNFSYVKVDILSNIPVGQGISSSTSDLVATVRAFEYLLDFKLADQQIIECLKLIEPHDPVFIKDCCIYNHRKGEIIKKLNYTPKVPIISIESGNIVDTVAFNSSLEIADEQITSSEKYLKLIMEAFEQKCDQKIFSISTMEAIDFLNSKNDSRLDLIGQITNQYAEEILGFVIGHSGSCLGVIPKKTWSRDIVYFSHLLRNLTNHAISIYRTFNYNE